MKKVFDNAVYITIRVELYVSLAQCSNRAEL